MKQKFSVRELKEFCEKNPPKEITYYTENQNTAYEPCILRLHFQNVLIFENPNTVCLKSDKNSVCFEQVRFAKVEKIQVSSVNLGTVLELHCGNRRTPKQTAVYTLVLS